MKDRLLEMTTLVQQKTEEVAQLKQKFAEQKEMLKTITQQFEGNSKMMKQEMKTLQQTVSVHIKSCWFLYLINFSDQRIE